ncbi:MAG: hypothetical protein K8L99_09540 [Anaerolineae bacterium]|nr:hypothetical protein [Anaerolineae bacterium]
MARTEGTFSERIGARISPELKAHLQALTENGQFDSEADIVREALWMYVEQVAPSAIQEAAPTTPQAQGSGSMEWSMHVLLIMMAMLGSRILNTLRHEKIKPAELMDEAIQETIFNEKLLREKLMAAMKLAQETKLPNEDNQ